MAIRIYLLDALFVTALLLLLGCGPAQSYGASHKEEARKVSQQQPLHSSAREAKVLMVELFNQALLMNECFSDFINPKLGAVKLDIDLEQFDLVQEANLKSSARHGFLDIKPHFDKYLAKILALKTADLIEPQALFVKHCNELQLKFDWQHKVIKDELVLFSSYDKRDCQISVLAVEKILGDIQKENGSESMWNALLTAGYKNGKTREAVIKDFVQKWSTK